MCSSFPLVTPGKPRSTMNAEKCSPSTLAKTMKMSAKPPLVIHIFSPLSSHDPSAWRTALARALSASDPDPDSLRQYAPTSLAADDARQVLLLLRRRAEAEDRNDRQAGLRAERRREARRLADGLADDDRRGLVRSDAADVFRYVDADQAERAGAGDQVAGDLPVLLLEFGQRRRHFVGDELRRGLRDQPMFLAQPLGREDVVGVGFTKQPVGAEAGGHGNNDTGPTGTTGTRWRAGSGRASSLGVLLNEERVAGSHEGGALP